VITMGASFAPAPFVRFILPASTAEGRRN
jgi:hypothetical protein